MQCHSTPDSAPLVCVGYALSVGYESAAYRLAARLGLAERPLELEADEELHSFASLLAQHGATAHAETDERRVANAHCSGMRTTEEIRADLRVNGHHELAGQRDEVLQSFERVRISLGFAREESASDAGSACMTTAAPPISTSISTQLSLGPKDHGGTRIGYWRGHPGDDRRAADIDYEHLLSQVETLDLELLARGLAPLEPQGWREGFLERVRAQLDTQGLLVVEDAEDLELTERPGWRIGDRYVGRDGVGVAVDVILGESGEQIGIYGCEGTDRLVYEYGPDDACCSPLSELRSLKASPIVRSLAAAWLSGKPVMMTQIASLSRWVFERGAAGPELLGEALRMTTAKAEELITFSGWAAS